MPGRAEGEPGHNRGVLSSVLFLVLAARQEPVVPERVSQTLLAAEMNSILPTWLPERFVFRDCRIDLGTEAVETTATVEFWADEGRSVVVEMASETLGYNPLIGPDGKAIEDADLVPVNVGLLGPISFDYAKVGEWSAFQTALERAAGQGYPSYGRVSGQGLTQAEAKKVIENLARAVPGQ
jgi:hypothetical protein